MAPARRPRANAQGLVRAGLRQLWPPAMRPAVLRPSETRAQKDLGTGDALIEAAREVVDARPTVLAHVYERAEPGVAEAQRKILAPAILHIAVIVRERTLELVHLCGEALTAQIQ